jgi:rhamnose utilization protein RhaD (predicted bifunctional aldolase and dehydrogenase)
MVGKLPSASFWPDMSEFEALRHLSARIGSDPLLVQAAGGNTSIKSDDVMWIKASGTWLSEALTKDIFVPLDMPRLAAALAVDDPDCESCLPFIRSDLNNRGLRPSIETSVHGLMPQAVVIHVHCVSTIARAMCSDARENISGRLQNFNWSYIPYARPGLQLSRAIRQNIKPGSDVLILGNHGLAVAAETVALAEELLKQVTEALALAPRPESPADVAYLESLLPNSSYRLPYDPLAHSAATDPQSATHGLTKVFYPDHVVFLGATIPADVKSGAAAVAIPGKGVLVNINAKLAVEPMLRCLGDVFRRIEDPAKLQALTPNDIDALLNWDAEKYRQTLKQ